MEILIVLELIDWSTSVLTDSYLTRSFQSLWFLLATHDFLLEQVNTNPTRGPAGQIFWIYALHPILYNTVLHSPGLK